MATFVRHTSCEQCGSSDAKALYSNGGSFCFSCRHSSRATRGFTPIVEEKSYTIPDDLSHDFPEVVLNWIKPTGITVEELLRNDYYFSANTTSLYRRLRGLSGDFQAFDVRCLGSYARTKSLFLGSKEEVDGYAFFKGSSPSVLILCEDSLSSIKLARVTSSAALFGTHCPLNKLKRVCEPFSEVVVWLDSDKWKESLKMAETISLLGKRARSVYTDKDPKYLTEGEIYGKLEGGTS